MKKTASLAIAVLLTIFLVACQSENPHEESIQRQIRMTAEGKTYTVTLEHIK